MKKLLKSIYQVFPFKQQIFTAIRSVVNLPESIFRHLYFNGVFRVKAGDRAFFRIHHFGQVIENELFWKGLYGGWEKKSMEIWVQLCRNSKTIFDIGANTGIYSLAAKAVHPLATVYAFEPVHRVYERLVANMKLNNYDVHCIEKAASDYDGKAMIYDSHEEHILSVTVNKNISGTAHELNEEIDTVQLKTFIDQHHIESIDLMKIDVETHEPEVLKGMGRFLATFKPVILIEILTQEIADTLNQQLSGLGYLYYYIDDENASTEKVDLITKRKSLNYLLCTQKEAAILSL
ncbi:MAG: FkbM family methyltransferase [Terrimonas sp.]|nr:FkbM family methyltransferase [Terrimonas sp.]